jgi:hypothetical protein
MSTYEFIKQNKDRILNIDGNLDEGNITIRNDNGCLEFYYFEEGILVNAKTKNPNLRKW